MDTDMPTDTDMAMKDSGKRLAATTGVFWCCLAMPVMAQQTGSVITPIATPSGQNVSGAAPVSIPNNQGGTESDGANQARAWNVTPRIGLTGTLSDNINLSSTDKQTGFITQLSPGIRIDARTARLKMFLDYSLNGLRYSTGNTSNNVQNALNAFGTLEAIDNWLFLDFSGRISQQIINPFGVQAPSSIYDNTNLTETSTYRLSPYIRGQLGGSADYFLRYNASVTNYQNSSLSDVSLSQWLGQVRGNTRFQNLIWTIDGSQQNTDYSRGRNYEDARLRGLLTYQLYPEFRISGSGGYETNNYQSIDNEGQSTYGYGFDWTPTERTKVSGFQERRFFGNGHNVLISHRFPLSSIRYTDVRDVALIPNQSSTIGLGTVYDQYFDQFASLIPDATARAAYVTNLLNQAGIAPNAQAVSDYAAQRPRVQRRQQLSMVLYGSRNSLTFLAARNENEALTVFGQNTAIAGEASRIVQQGFTLSFLHRLTPLTGLNLLGTRYKSKSGLTDALDTTTTSYQIGVSTRLGAKTSGSLNVRHTNFDSDTNPYNENAIVASLTMFF
jgi:uncharacterized protein (PEP-CTERM system associated)